MVALMKFTRDICRLLGLGSGKKRPTFQKLPKLILNFNRSPLSDNKPPDSIKQRVICNTQSNKVWISDSCSHLSLLLSSNSVLCKTMKVPLLPVTPWLAPLPSLRSWCHKVVVIAHLLKHMPSLEGVITQLTSVILPYFAGDVNGKAKTIVGL